MERREKVDFILEQMRLCLAKKDFIRTQIISKKISPKVFENNQEQVCPEVLAFVCHPILKVLGQVILYRSCSCDQWEC